MMAADVAAELSGRPVRTCRPLNGGRNSRVFRVECEDGRLFALKAYPPRDRDPRDRLGAEERALRFMAAHHFTCVPASIAARRDEGFALLSWIQGERVAVATRSDIDSAVQFLAALHALRHASDTAGIELAAEACLSAEEVVRQTRRRLTRLQEVAEVHPMLAHALDSKFRPELDRAETRARDGYARNGLDFAAQLSPEFHALSPSDFGFHNALRRADGTLVFIDFEYFGWDDPAKLICETMIHPATELDSDLTQRFFSAALAVYRDDPCLPARIDMLRPLYRLRWCMILLNEFLPERWAVRAHAGASAQAESQARQLEKALVYLDAERTLTVVSTREACA